ncbi:MAG: hypothetical protein K2K80_04525 [Clostridia bacterium]|nr:hypothetical protein [Clostridia bacterium]
MSFDYSGTLDTEQIKSKAEELAKSLQYEFDDLSHLCQALYCKKIGGSKSNYANSAIALVGDNVLKLALSRKFYMLGADKKSINKQKEEYENNKQLKKVCDELEIYKYAFNDENFYSDNLPNNKKLPRPKHDPYVEAVIGAIYLDRGFDYANEWINKQLIPMIEESL